MDGNASPRKRCKDDTRARTFPRRLAPQIKAGIRVGFKPSTMQRSWLFVREIVVTASRHPRDEGSMQEEERLERVGRRRGKSIDATHVRSTMRPLQNSSSAHVKHDALCIESPCLSPPSHEFHGLNTRRSNPLLLYSTHIRARIHHRPLSRFRDYIAKKRMVFSVAQDDRTTDLSSRAREGVRGLAREARNITPTCPSHDACVRRFCAQVFRAPKASWNSSSSRVGTRSSFPPCSCNGYPPSPLVFALFSSSLPPS